MEKYIVRGIGGRFYGELTQQEIAYTRKVWTRCGKNLDRRKTVVEKNIRVQIPALISKMPLSLSHSLRNGSENLTHRSCLIFSRGPLEK